MNKNYKNETELEYIFGLIKRGKVTNLDQLSEIVLLQSPQDILLAISCMKFKSDSYSYITERTKCYLKSFAKKFSKNKEIMLNAIICGYSLSCVDPELLNDRDFVFAAIKRGAEPIPDQFKDDIEIIKAYIKYDGMRLKDLSDTHKNDINFIKIALKYEWHIVQYIDKKWMDDVDFVKYVVMLHPNFLRYASESILNIVWQEVSSNDNPYTSI